MISKPMLVGNAIKLYILIPGGVEMLSHSDGIHTIHSRVAARDGEVTAVSCATCGASWRRLTAQRVRACFGSTRRNGIHRGICVRFCGYRLELASSNRALWLVAATICKVTYALFLARLDLLTAVAFTPVIRTTPHTIGEVAGITELLSDLIS